MERPGFKQMISDIESGKISAVFVKDMSRLGRNYLKVGFYTEEFFVEHDIRLVAVSDGIDTAEGEDDFMPFRNIMAEWYAKDVSQKTKAAFNAKAKDGQYFASKPPFGYKKSPDDKHKLIIDEEAADVVKRIFAMASEGYGYNKLWDKAHSALSVRRKETKNKEPHIFAGVIKCTDCGSALLYNNRKLSEKTAGEFKCSKYSRQGKEACTSHYTTYNKVYNTVFDSIKQLAVEACKNEGELLKKLEVESRAMITDNSKKSVKERENLENRIAALDLIIKRLYEDSVLGRLSPERFDTMMNDYEKEQLDLKLRLEEILKSQGEQSMLVSQLGSFVDIIKEVKDLTELNGSIIQKLINRIEIGQATVNSENGKKEQYILITYKLFPKPVGFMV